MEACYRMDTGVVVVIAEDSHNWSEKELGNEEIIRGDGYSFYFNTFTIANSEVLGKENEIINWEYQVNNVNTPNAIIPIPLNELEEKRTK